MRKFKKVVQGLTANKQQNRIQLAQKKNRNKNSKINFHYDRKFKNMFRKF